MRRTHLLPAALASLALAAPAAASAATLVVRAEGIQGTAGEVKVTVCDKGFDEAGCKLGAWRAPTGPAEEFVFEDVAPGRYAVAAYHDADGDGELDKIPPGIPTEPYGFSNEVGRLGIPSFQKALVEVGEGRTTVVVRLARFLGRS
jgi:uncharacterized protein (DUF2141 family)